MTYDGRAADTRTWIQLTPTFPLVPSPLGGEDVRP